MNLPEDNNNNNNEKEENEKCRNEETSGSNIKFEKERGQDTSNEHDTEYGSKDFISNGSSYESDESVEFEREEGDGQESVPIHKIDDDEDKKNPQYIPKRGTFYEHDDRTLEESETEENTDKNEKNVKKTIWIDKKDHWTHDRYNDAEQAPKSKAELIAIYGYDIRNEEGPPKARRRRRYGRGPSKYTRNWEDEDAYKLAKPIKKSPRRVRKNKDFPELTETKESETKKDSNSDIQENTEISSEVNVSANDTTVSENSNDQNKEVVSPVSNVINLENVNKNQQVSDTLEQESSGPGRTIKSNESMKEIKDSDYKGFTKSRQYRSSKSEQKILPKGKKKIDRQIINSSKSFNNKTPHLEDIEKNINSLNKLTLNDGFVKHNNKQNRQVSVPPRLQGEQKGSKRYSSLRQRSLPETAVSSYQQTGFYSTEYAQQTPPQQVTTASILPHTNATIYTNSVTVPQVPPPPLQPIPQVPVTNTALLPTQPQYVASFPPAAPTPFLPPPNVSGPAFIPPQPSPATLINYVPGQPQYSQPGTFQGFQTQQFSPVTQQAEIYQYQAGTTYYSTQNQHMAQRSAPPKRPKAAIPIIPPPQEPRAKGKNSNHNEVQSSDMTKAEELETGKEDTSSSANS